MVTWEVHFTNAASSRIHVLHFSAHSFFPWYFGHSHPSSLNTFIRPLLHNCLNNSKSCQVLVYNWKNCLKNTTVHLSLINWQQGTRWLPENIFCLQCTIYNDFFKSCQGVKILSLHDDVTGKPIIAESHQSTREHFLKRSVKFPPKS